MAKLNFPRPRRQPVVVLTLLLNMLLLGGGSVLWWSAGSSGPANLLLGGARSRAGYGWGWEQEQVCERPVLEEKTLNEWGCKVFHKACFDQGRLLLHSGQKTPGHPNFTANDLFEVAAVPPYVLPGYGEPLGSAHYSPKHWDFEIRAPTLYDPPDVWQPKEFTNCTVPMVWWLTYYSIFADLYIGSSLALSAMLAEGAFDRNITLAPNSYGLDLLPLYQSLLDPYTRYKVTTLAELSSREHIHDGQPRCFDRALVCNIVSMYSGSGIHGWAELQPKTVGRRTVEHYRRLYPNRFQPHEEQAAKEKGQVFRVAFMPRANMRSIVNLKQVMQECKKWKLPAGTKYKRVSCVALPDGTPDNFPDLLGVMQNVKVLVNTHGSGNTFAWFMGNGSALVEVLGWNFHGKGCTWADQYYSDWYEIDQTVNTGYFRLIADRNHVFPGPYEKNKTGSGAAWPRDQDVSIHFPTLAKVLAKVARQELKTTIENREERYFYMTDEEKCPGTIDYERQKAEEAAKHEQELRDMAEAAAAREKEQKTQEQRELEEQQKQQQEQQQEEEKQQQEQQQEEEEQQQEQQEEEKQQQEEEQQQEEKQQQADDSSEAKEQQQQAAAEQPAEPEKQPTEQQKAEQQAAEKQPTEQQPTEEQAAEKQPTEQQAAEKQQ